MGVVVHGEPGRSIATAAAKYRPGDARRGAWFEGITGRALERWLATRSDEVHLFHDLGGFRNVAGHGYKPLSLGTANLDHVILTASGWVLVNAKGCGAGSLGLDENGNGTLTKADGSVQPQGWLDDGRSYSQMGVLVRLTGLTGCAVWLLPDATEIDPALAHARCARRSQGAFLTVSGVLAGELNDLGPLRGRQLRADPAAVAALSAHVLAVGA
jgi:hypothetical protein